MGVFYTIPALQVNRNVTKTKMTKMAQNDKKNIFAACAELWARVGLNGKSRFVFLQLSVRETSKPILEGLVGSQSIFVKKIHQKHKIY